MSALTRNIRFAGAAAAAVAVFALSTAAAPAPTVPDPTEVETSVRSVALAEPAAPTPNGPTPNSPATTVGQRATRSWQGHGRPNQMIIIRSATVDTVTGGVLTFRSVRPAGDMTISTLDRLVPSSWITIDNGVARLSAAVVLTPGVTLTIGGDVRQVQLAGGATAPEAASIYTGSGRLVVNGAGVTSVDPATGQPLVAGAGRPFVLVSPRGRLEATDATFSDLGTPAADPHDAAGVTFGADSTGFLLRTSLLRNTTGLRLNGSAGVGLDTVTIGNSGTNGLILRGDQGTTLTAVTTSNNIDNGVLVIGPSSPRPITGLSSSGNGQFGVVVDGQAGPQLRAVSTRANGAGGLRVAGSTDVAVSGLTTVDEPIAVYTHLQSQRVALAQLDIAGGNGGVKIEKSTTGVTVAGSTLTGARTGISDGGHDVTVTDTTISGATSGLRVERGAAGITATRLTVSDGTDGIVTTPGTTGVVLRDVVLDGMSNHGVRTFAPGAQIVGGRISGGVTGIDAQAATAVSGVSITDVGVGIRVRSPDRVTADRVDVAARTSGIDVDAGAAFVLTNSHVVAMQAVTGKAQIDGPNNSLSLPQLNVLGAIGVPLILLALILEEVQRVRQRTRGGDVLRLPPAPHAGAH